MDTNKLSELMIISAFLIGVATTFFTIFALRMNMTCYDYINKLRIERATIPLMREHPEYKYEYIASESSFSSINTFRRAFCKSDRPDSLSVQSLPNFPERRETLITL